MDAEGQPGIPRMSAGEREQLALAYWRDRNGMALRSLFRTADEARAVAAGFAQAQHLAAQIEVDLQRIRRVFVRSSDDGELVESFEFWDGAVPVCSQDCGTGADTIGTKRCPDCKRDRPTPEFGVRRSRKDSMGIYCRSCIRLQREKRKQAELRGSRPRVDAERVAEIRAMRQAGIPFSQIASKTGVSIATAWRLCAAGD